MSNETDPFPRIRLPSIHTWDLGRAVGEWVQPGMVIALQGGLGAGKTTFTQGLAEGMGIDDRATSPTFTLVNEYGHDAPVRLIHIDTYRLGDLPEYALLESATFGLEDILDESNLVDSSGGGAVVVIEWAERVESVLPEDHLLVQIDPDGVEQYRSVTCTAFGPQSAAVVRRISTTLT